MAKPTFEEMGGTYIRVGDYFLPDLKLPETETQSIGICGISKSIAEFPISIFSQAEN